MIGSGPDKDCKPDYFWLGLSTADKRFLFWEDLRQIVGPLNVQMSNRLSLSMSACGGVEVLRVFMQDPHGPAPVRYVVGPQRSEGENDLADGFSNFFVALLAKQSWKVAFNALKLSVKSAGALSAEQVFADGWNSALQERSPSQQSQLVERFEQSKAKFFAYDKGSSLAEDVSHVRLVQTVSSYSARATELRRRQKRWDDELEQMQQLDWASMPTEIEEAMAKMKSLYSDRRNALAARAKELESRLE